MGAVADQFAVGVLGGEASGGLAVVAEAHDTEEPYVGEGGEEGTGYVSEGEVAAEQGDEGAEEEGAGGNVHSVESLAVDEHGAVGVSMCHKGDVGVFASH